MWAAQLLYCTCSPTGETCGKGINFPIIVISCIPHLKPDSPLPTPTPSSTQLLALDNQMVIHPRGRTF
jgi:hypothetical protein